MNDPPRFQALRFRLTRARCSPVSRPSSMWMKRSATPKRRAAWVTTGTARFRCLPMRRYGQRARHGQDGGHAAGSPIGGSAVAGDSGSPALTRAP